MAGSRTHARGFQPMPSVTEKRYSVTLCRRTGSRSSLPIPSVSDPSVTKCDVCHANCMRDEGRSLGVGRWGQIPNHLKLPGSRALVVSVDGKGEAETSSGVMYGDERKRTADDLSKLSSDDVKTGSGHTLGISLAVTHVLAKRRPVVRRRERASGFHAEHENLSSR